MAYQINDYYFNKRYQETHGDQILQCDSNILSYNGPDVIINDSFAINNKNRSVDISKVNVPQMSDPSIMQLSPEIIYYLYNRIVWIKNKLLETNLSFDVNDDVIKKQQTQDPYSNWFSHMLKLVYKPTLNSELGENYELSEFIDTYTTLGKYYENLRGELDTFFEKAKVFINTITKENQNNASYYEGFNLIYNKIFNEARESDGNSQSNSYQRSLTSNNSYQHHKPIPIPLPPAPEDEKISNNAAYINLFVILFLILATIAGVITFIIA